MILIVENWDKEGEKEQAILLDECPSPLHESMNSSLEPWAEGGSLASCLDTAEAKGRADLFLVFFSDTRSSWGVRKVTALAGGVLQCDAIPGGLVKFEVVARHLFGNIVGVDSDLPYRVLEEAFLAPDPDKVGGLLAPNAKHPSLGFAVAQRDIGQIVANDEHLGVDPSYGTGVRIKYFDQTGYV